MGESGCRRGLFSGPVDGMLWVNAGLGEVHVTQLPLGSKWTAPGPSIYAGSRHSLPGAQTRLVKASVIYHRVRSYTAILLCL